LRRHAEVKTPRGTLPKAPVVLAKALKSWLVLII
jgi:hypothetical protein